MTPPTAMTALARRFVECQPPLSQNRANTIAQRVLDGNVEVAAAARTWAETGEMPDAPSIEGLTPAGLSRMYLPTQIFGVLTLIADDASKISLLEDLPMLALDPPPHRDMRY